MRAVRVVGSQLLVCRVDVSQAGMQTAVYHEWLQHSTIAGRAAASTVLRLRGIIRGLVQGGEWESHGAEV
jgi:hypothetical protein